MVQCSPFIMLCLGSIGMDSVVSESRDNSTKELKFLCKVS